MSKCPEMIGYVGDVRNLEAKEAEATSNKKIEAWVTRSNSVVYATLFYSSDDVYHVGRMQSKLLKINPNLKFQQISSIKKFIDYVDTGMDRGEHPVKNIEMIHVYTTWEIDVNYVEEARKRHEPEVRQISREDLQKMGDAFVKKTIINIFLGNKEQNKTKPLTDAEVHQRVKDEYGWDQASAVKDQIMTVADTAKSGVDELKEKRELLTKGIKGLPDVEPQTLRMKMIGGAIKAINPISEIMDANKKLDGVKTAQIHLKKSQESYEKCMKEYGDFNSKHFANEARCLQLQNNMLLRFQGDMFKAGDLEALDPQNIRKIEEAIKRKQVEGSK